MTSQTVYRSTDAAVIAAWEDTQERHRDLAAKVRALREEFPNHPPIVYSRNGRAWFSHLDFEQGKPPGEFGNPPTPTGWRIQKHGSSTYLGWVPDKRTKEGKAMAGRLDELEVRGMGHFPGMPSMVLAGGHWYSHGSLVHEGVAYANWGCPFELVEDSGWGRDTFDAELWTRCPMSEFWVAKEAHDALHRHHAGVDPGR